MDVYKMAENKDGLLEVLYDRFAESPREWGNIGTMSYGHGSYNLGDEKAANIELYNSWDEWLEGEVLEPNGGSANVIFLPLYLYDHSGITMNTTGFNCPWDSGQVGWIWATRENLLKNTGCTEEELFENGIGEEVLKGEVRDFDDYLRGNVYGFRLSKKKKCECCSTVEFEELDSCFGFYGDGIEDDLEGYIPEEYHELIGQLKFA